MSKFLDDFCKQAQDWGYHIFRVSEIIGEEDPQTLEINPAGACLNCYSVAKVFTVTAIGMLYDKGLLSVDEKIIDIFPEYVSEKTDPRFEKMTVDNVLCHACGFTAGMLDIDCYGIHENFGKDFLKYIFETPLCYEPDKGSSYSDAAYYLLSRVFTKKCGKKMDDYLWEHLFYPLEFQEAAWSRCPHNYPMGATGLYIRSRDMAKLGVVYMQKGIYRDMRILSEEWVNITLSKPYELHPVYQTTACNKGGMFGQQLVVIPSQNRVVAWHAFDQKATKGNLVEWCANYK
ncbi:MAG: beta-lactamase family protein [Clostridia bacterium]|nr:beta-lactamase family protein [Clostridia bacterium]